MTGSKAPDAFRTIGEVAAWLGVSAHVLRFWETKFPQIKPVKRAGGRRYYRPQDMELLGGIRQLLHEDGLTIKGAQKVLRERGVKAVAALSPPLDPERMEKGAAPRKRARPPAATAAPDAAAPSPPDSVKREIVAPASPAGERIQTGGDAPAERDVPTDPVAAAGQSDPSEPNPPFAPDQREMPPRAPLPGVPEGQMGLFGDLAPLDNAAEEAAPLVQEPDATDGARPSVAPLPGADLPLAEALAHLRPGQVPAERLRPFLARAEALRARMATAV